MLMILTKVGDSATQRDDTYDYDLDYSDVNDKDDEYEDDIDDNDNDQSWQRWATAATPLDVSLLAELRSSRVKDPFLGLSSSSPSS